MDSNKKNLAVAFSLQNFFIIEFADSKAEILDKCTISDLSTKSEIQGRITAVLAQVQDPINVFIDEAMVAKKRTYALGNKDMSENIESSAAFKKVHILSKFNHDEKLNQLLKPKTQTLVGLDKNVLQNIQSRLNKMDVKVGMYFATNDFKNFHPNYYFGRHSGLKKQLLKTHINSAPTAQNQKLTSRFQALKRISMRHPSPVAVSAKTAHTQQGDRLTFSRLKQAISQQKERVFPNFHGFIRTFLVVFTVMTVVGYAFIDSGLLTTNKSRFSKIKPEIVNVSPPANIRIVDYSESYNWLIDQKIKTLILHKNMSVPALHIHDENSAEFADYSLDFADNSFTLAQSDKDIHSKIFKVNDQSISATTPAKGYFKTPEIPVIGNYFNVKQQKVSKLFEYDFKTNA